jgi:hypothetical protein
VVTAPTSLQLGCDLEAFLGQAVGLLVLPWVFFAAYHYFKKGGGIRHFVLSIAPTKRTDELRRLLQSARSFFVTAAIFSLAINLLYLAGPLYMLQIYDRVISSASEVTLVMLSIALVMAYIALAGLDTVRARVLTRASIRLGQKIAARVMTANHLSFAKHC